MRKILTGKVISCGKMTKTATIEVETRRPHPLYKKIVKKNKKYLVHVEGKEIKVGDVVKIKETLPVSSRKHFEVLEVLS